MKEQKFKVEIYYSGFCTYEINAINEETAILLARKMPIKNAEIMNNLESWQEADTAILIENGNTEK